MLPRRSERKAYDITSQQRINNNAEREKTNLEDLRKSTDAWRKKMEAQVDELNKKHGRKALFIVPVGDAVITMREMIAAGKFPGVTKQADLFTDPIGHGRGQVRALATYCNFAAIYRHSPEGLKMSEQGVDAEQHAALQKIAWETVSAYPYSGVEKSK